MLQEAAASFQSEFDDDLAKPEFVFQSTRSPIQIPNVSVTDYVFEHFDRYGESIAIEDPSNGETLTYAEIRRLSLRGATFLQQLGIAKGDRVCLLIGNVPWFPVAAYSVLGAGAVVVPVNPLASEDDLLKILKGSGARSIIFDSPSAKAVRAVSTRIDVTVLLSLGEDGDCPSLRSIARSDVPIVDPPLIDAANDLAAMPFSSGTTGEPKGVLLTHRNLVANMAQLDAVLGVNSGEMVLTIPPFFHIYGLSGVLNNLLRHGAHLLAPRNFALEAFLQTIQDRRVQRAMVVPPIVLALAKHPLVSSFDLSSLKYLLTGAAALTKDIADTTAERLGVAIIEGYGMTEAGPMSHFNSLASGQQVHGSVGQLLANTQCRIADLKTGNALGPNEVGELQLKGPQVMRGYIGEEPTVGFTSDMWLRTGDVGYVDDRGFAYIVDRTKEFIKYQGYQISPSELEARLQTHQAIMDCAVIPSPDPENGEVPKAFIVLKAGQNVSAASLIDFAARGMAPYKKIRELAFVDAIPRSTTGKILRRTLLEQERLAVAEASKNLLQGRIRYDADDGVATITLARTRRGNAVDYEMIVGLAEALTKMESDENVRCGIISADGEVFSTGLDLGSVGPLVVRDQFAVPADLIDPFAFPGVAGARSKPLIAAVQGACWNVGLEIALACDIVIAGDGATFASQEVARGIFPLLGGSVRLPMKIGQGPALAMLLTAEEVNAQEARQLGIVHQVVERGKVGETALALARKIATRAPLGVAAVLRSIGVMASSGTPPALRGLAEDAKTVLLSRDAKEGVRSVQERRDPVYEGK